MADVFDTALLQSEPQALDYRIFEPYGVRAAGWISLSGCQLLMKMRDERLVKFDIRGDRCLIV